LEAALAESELRWGEPFLSYVDKLMIQVEAAADTVELEIQVDTHHISVDEVKALVLDLEALVVEAAFDPDLPTKVRSTPPAGSGPGPESAVI
jgi:hypothetical protein